MSRKFTKIFLAAVAIVFSNTIYAQNKFFIEAQQSKLKELKLKRVIIPEKFRAVTINIDELSSFLKKTPSENLVLNKVVAPVLDIPMPDGTTAKFFVWESSVMAPELAAKFPNIKTYAGQGITDPSATIKLDITEFGFHAMILSRVTGSVFIDPYAQGTTNEYISYYKKDFKGTNKTFTEVGVNRKNKVEKKPVENNLTNDVEQQNSIIPENNTSIKSGRKTTTRPPLSAFSTFPTSREEVLKQNRRNRPSNILAGSCVGSTLRTYRLAVACTGEYAQAATGLGTPTTAQALSAIITSVTRIDGVYESELAIRLILIANNNLVVFTNPATDPFNGNNNPNILIDESQAQITSIIGSANFDIGHTFSTGGGGFATLGAVCINADKASGITGDANPVGDPYDIDYVCHEMGHQFGADHIYNSTTGACGGGNESDVSNSEPGSGSTIMSYAGLCGSNDLQNNSDPYFGAVSFDEITEYISNGAGAGCATLSATGNTAPQVDAGTNYIIPVSTPFVLTGDAMDADGDDLTYSWEQINTGGPHTNWDAPSGNAPIFRSFAPVTTSVRYFPRLFDVRNNVTTIGEIKPSYARTLKFRLTARDNSAGGGGVCYDTMSVVVSAASGPFLVTYPTAPGVSWQGGETRTITWDVAGTTSSPVNCANVIIQLSLDGGFTFPVILLANTPNDGTADITVPQVNSALARVRVIAADNVFYDMSNNNLSIGATAEVDTCNFVSLDASQVIPDIIDNINGQGFTFSTITVPAEFGVTITDLDVVGIAGSHGYINDLGIRLISPSNSGAVLINDIRDGNNPCTASTDFYFNIDDESPDAVIPCPPTGITTVQPVEPLSIFDGENSAGEWVLQVVDLFPDEDDGVLLGWGLRFCSPTVPVTWQTFTAKQSVDKNNTLLSWSVNEYNNAYYEIERSVDGINYIKIGKVDAGRNNNGMMASYIYTDMKPVTGTNYYRLKQYDLNGKYSYSVIAKVDFEKVTAAWTVYPNPAREKINIVSNTDAKNVGIQLFDATGKLLYNNQLNNTTKGQSIPVNINYLAKGVYSLKITTSGDKVKVNKIIIR